MTHSLVLFAIYALACYRLTRLAIDDDILVLLRDRLSEWAHVGKIKKTSLTRSDKVRLEVWKLATCYWCLSIWVASVVVLLAYFQGSWFQWVCAVLALSSVTGMIAEKL